MRRFVKGAALLGHFCLCLSLNFKNKQAMVYGYVVPIFFLLAFGGVFRSGTPVLLHEMGQLLTITILGGACFGLPTTLVAERERGVWRRYRLLPVNTAELLTCTLAARLVMVALPVFIQVILARLLYGTPFPLHLLQTGAAFLLVTFCFLSLGLVVAALAENVPAVQALGQCIFLPMIMVGGVGVPLSTLPPWAQTLAAFMPGRYAVDVLQKAISDPRGLRDASFSMLALVIIGAACGCIGLILFRWDAGTRREKSPSVWILGALLSWAVVGLIALRSGHRDPLPEAAAFEAITDAQIERISFNDLPDDDGIVTPLARSSKGSPETPEISEFRVHLEAWRLGRIENPGENIRHLVNVAAIADLSQNPREAAIARVIFEEMKTRFNHDQLRRGLAWTILSPEQGTAISKSPELGLAIGASEVAVRRRSVFYAKKFLGRIEEKLRD